MAARSRRWVRTRDHLEWYVDKRGWWVFPVVGKQPATAHGFKDATQDAIQIKRWWDREDPPGIGVDCGRSNIVVIDVDRPAAVGELASAGYQLPKTLTAITGGGGCHFVYQAGDVELRNTTGNLPGVGDIDGVDVRAAGGYIVAPPSLHESGRTYEFMPPSWAYQPAPAPDWLRPAPPKPRTPFMEAVLAAKRTRRGGGGYVAAAIRGEADAVATAVEGTRNHQLVKSAFSLGTLGVDESEVESVLVTATNLPDREAVATIRSGYRAGLQHPRGSR